MDAQKGYAMFLEKFRIPELEILQVGSWVVSQRPVQPTLGSLVVSISRPCGSFSSISPMEAAELATVYRRVESAIGQFVGHEKMNYLALMMVDAHLHFHAIPRYEGVRAYAGRQYPDVGWPALPVLSGEPLTGAEASQLNQALRNAFERL